MRVRERVIVRRRLNVTFDRQNSQNSRLFAETVYFRQYFVSKVIVFRKFENCASRAYVLRDSSRIGDIASSIRTFGELAPPRMNSSLVAD